jgi:hypothetical protein
MLGQRTEVTREVTTESPSHRVFPMQSIKVLSLVMTLALGWCAQRYESANLVFTRAYLRSPDIEFDAPVDVDWERLARSHYGDARLANPDRDELRKQWSEISSASTIEYRADVPPMFRSGSFYLLAESGSGFVEPAELHGAVTYATDQAATRISQPSFSGNVHARRPARAGDAGFVVYSPVRFTVSTIDALSSRNQEPRLSVRRDGDENVFTLAYRGKLIAVDRKPAKYPVLQSSALFSFQQNSAAYLLIRWAPDKDCIEACCEHAYSLYRIGDFAERVLENSYDCDV